MASALDISSPEHICILFQVGITNLVCGYILGSGSVSNIKREGTYLRPEQDFSHPFHNHRSNAYSDGIRYCILLRTIAAWNVFKQKLTNKYCTYIIFSKAAEPIKLKLHTGGHKSLHKVSKSHHKDGRHSFNWYKPLSIFSSTMRPMT